VVWRSG